MEFIYLYHMHTHSGTHSKIGRTDVNPYERYRSSYIHADAIKIAFFLVPKKLRIEQRLIELLDSQFDRARKYGIESFYGDPYEMRRIIISFFVLYKIDYIDVTDFDEEDIMRIDRSGIRNTVIMSENTKNLLRCSKKREDSAISASSSNSDASSSDIQDEYIDDITESNLKQCKRCMERFPKTKSLIKHLKNTTICSGSFDRLKQLEYLLDLQKRTCDNCEKPFSTKQRLQSHILTNSCQKAL